MEILFAGISLLLQPVTKAFNLPNQLEQTKYDSALGASINYWYYAECLSCTNAVQKGRSSGKMVICSPVENTNGKFFRMFGSYLKNKRIYVKF
jgi:hypothetical protein